LGRTKHPRRIAMDSSHFTLNDYRQLMVSIAKPSLFRRVLWWIVTLFQLQPREMRSVNDSEVKTPCRQSIGIIDAMTPDERANPQSIDRPQIIRIAEAAGVSQSQVENLLAAYESTCVANLHSRNTCDKSTDDNGR
jgi:signal recognition particle subunit SRP54